MVLHKTGAALTCVGTELWAAVPQVIFAETFVMNSDQPFIDLKSSVLVLETNEHGSAILN